MCDRRIWRSIGRHAALALVVLTVVINRPMAQGAGKPGTSVRVGLLAGTGSAPTVNPLSTLDLATLGAFKSRPLFAPSRRRPLPPQQALAALPPSIVETPPPDLRLIGVVAGAGRAVAILRRPAGGSALNLKVGDTVDTWRVDAIGPDRVSLRDGAREKTYRLFASAATPGPVLQGPKLQDITGPK